MINHGRTLLLNSNGGNRPDSTFFLEEYVPSDFLAQNLPQFLITTRNILMGEGADNAFMNYRLWQYMRLIHGTEFASYLYSLDQRITYLTGRSVIESAYTTESQALNVEAIDVPVFPIGEVGFNAAIPKLLNSWVVEVEAGLLVSSRSIQTNEISETAVTITEGLTDTIPMAGQQDFGIKIQADPLPVGAMWLVTSFTKPNSDVTALIEPLENSGSETLYRLFSNREPYKTFKDLWEKHFQVHYRLAGVILAWMYRAEENRLNG